MTGLIVKFNGHIYNAGLPKGVVSMAATTSKQGVDLNVGGLIMPEEVYPRWIISGMKPGDEVEIEVAEFGEASQPVVEDVMEALKKEMEDMGGKEYCLKNKLEEFRHLEKTLREEGLL